MSWIPRAVVLLIISLGLSHSAAAQTDSRVAVGASVSSKETGIPLPGASKLAVLWRLGSEREGWGPRYGLNWYSTDIEDTFGGTQAFGKLKVRPFLAGYGYAHRFGRVRVSANLLGGIAFSSLSARPGYETGFGRVITSEPLDFDVSNTFVLRPEVTAWVDLTRTIGLNVTAGYMVARPSVTLRTSRGLERRSLDADVLSLKIGAVYSIF